MSCFIDAEKHEKRVLFLLFWGLNESKESIFIRAIYALAIIQMHVRQSISVLSRRKCKGAFFAQSSESTFNGAYLDPEPNLTHRLQRKKFSREGESVTRGIAQNYERSIVVELFFRGILETISLTISFSEGGSRARRPDNSYVVLRTINTRRESGSLARCSHEEDSLSRVPQPPRPGEDRESPASLHGWSITDSNAAAPRCRPRAIELCIMPNALAKQYDRLKWRDGGDDGGNCEGEGKRERTIGGGSQCRWFSWFHDPRYIEGGSVKKEEM